MKTLQPPGWKKPRGYANGIAASGRMVFVAGQIGWDGNCEFQSHDLTGQFRQTLENTLAVLKEGGAGPEHVVRMTVYILDRDDYIARTKEIGAIWKELMGANYPAMAMVEVSRLIENDALIECETTAVVPQAT